MPKKAINPWLILVLLVLIGAVTSVTIMSQQNVTVYDAHDHDKDGVADHGSEAH